MARPRKHDDDRHDNQINLTLTNKQLAAVQAIADLKDIPKQVAARALLVSGLDMLTSCVGSSITNHAKH